MPTERKTTSKDGSVVSKWIVYYVGLDGKRNSKSFDQKSKALGFEKQARNDQQQKLPKITKGHLTFSDAQKKYYADSLVGRDGGERWCENTIVNHSRRVKQLHTLIEPDTPLRNMTPASMKVMRRTIQESAFARSSQVALWVLVKAILNYAATEEWITSNPAAGLTIRRQKLKDVEEEDDFEVFTKEEAKAIVDKAYELGGKAGGRPTRGYEDKWLMAPLFFESGMRSSEMFGLEWANVDLENGTITIRQSRSRRGGALKPVKAAASYRTLFISTTLLPHLKKLKAKKKTRFVFETTNGTMLMYDNTLRWWHKLLEFAGVRKSGFHKCRHYYASRLIEAGVDAKVLTTNMGHSDVAFTLKTYGHLFDDRDTRERKRQLAEALSLVAA